MMKNSNNKKNRTIYYIGLGALWGCAIGVCWGLSSADNIGLYLLEHCVAGAMLGLLTGLIMTKFGERILYVVLEMASKNVAKMVLPMNAWVCYNPDVGFTIIYPKISDNIPHATVDDITTLPPDASAAQLGSAILESLKKSENAPPPPKNTTGHYYSVQNWAWTSSSKESSTIVISQSDKNICITKAMKGKDGHYLFATQPTLKFPLDVTPEKLGAAAMELLTKPTGSASSGGS